MVTQIQLFESPNQNALDFFERGGGLDDERSLQKKVNAADEFLARILGTAAGIKKLGARPRRTTRDLHTPVAKCNEVDSGIYELLL